MYYNNFELEQAEKYIDKLEDDLEAAQTLNKNYEQKITELELIRKKLYEIIEIQNEIIDNHINFSKMPEPKPYKCAQKSKCIF